jgi:hypothetical protein
MKYENQLVEMLLLEHSRAKSLNIVHWIDDDSAKFAALMQLFFKAEYRISQRAATAISHFFDRNPDFFVEYVPKLVDFLKTANQPDFVKRNIMRILSDAPLPENLLGDIADSAFRYTADPAEASAIRAYSMIVAARICEKEPELARELHLIIEENLPHASAAFKSVGRKILKKLKKLMS